MTHSATSDHNPDGDDRSWDDVNEDFLHAEMLRHDRNRLIYSGLVGLVIALLLIGGAFAWVSAIRHIDSIKVESPPDMAQSADIETKLRALAPHEALSVSPAAASAQSKKVRAERIETKPE